MVNTPLMLKHFILLPDGINTIPVQIQLKRKLRHLKKVSSLSRRIKRIMDALLQYMDADIPYLVVPALDWDAHRHENKLQFMVRLFTDRYSQAQIVENLANISASSPCLLFHASAIPSNNKIIPLDGMRLVNGRLKQGVISPICSHRVD